MVIMRMKTFGGISATRNMYQRLMNSAQQIKVGRVRDARESHEDLIDVVQLVLSR